MSSNEEILMPKVLVVPKVDLLAKTLTGAEPGTIVMSGAELWICTATGTFQKVTHA